MANVQKARDEKTRQLFTDRKAFLSKLHRELESLELKAEREELIPAVRLNVASDLVWEKIDASIFSSHASIRFYDYTKGIKRALGALPDNYELTYSWNEHSSAESVFDLLSIGRNITVVFDTLYNPAQGNVDALPTSYALPGLNLRHALPVVDGDTSDIRLRALDGHGVIVGLRGKGGKQIVLDGVKGGFILPTIGGRLQLSQV